MKQTKKIIPFLLLFLVLGCKTTQQDPMAVITCYWTFDPAVEETEIVKTNQVPILLGFDDDSIDWDTYDVTNVKVAKTKNGEIWFPESLWDRYQMEGCGFYDENSDGVNDYVIQLSGTDFKYVGKDREFTDSEGNTYLLKNNQENVTIFTLLDITESKWGKAWDEQNGVESDLVPWQTVAVTGNVPSGLDKEIHFPFMKGYTLPNGIAHSGNFTPNDSSWSFSTEDLEYEGNEGIDCWIDIYVGTYANYLNLEEGYVLPLVEKGSKDISIKTVYKNIDGEWVGADLWVAPVKGTGLN